MDAITNREDVIVIASNAALESLYGRYLHSEDDYLQAAIVAGDAASLAAVYSNDVAIRSAEVHAIAEEIALAVVDGIQTMPDVRQALFVCIREDVYFQLYEAPPSEGRDAQAGEDRLERLHTLWNEEIRSVPVDRTVYLAGGAAAAAAGAAEEVWDDGYPEEEEQPYQ